ncbi:MAG: hypothetical protein IKK43_01100, partial [Clostridia bacterium]|nr:hypothetical protein [bacterium]MBR4110271.1 hypothetical protein [Clostridia bacterium]
IIIIIIIASVVIYSGFQKNVNKATFTKIYSEMQEVSTAVQERHAAHRINSSAYPYVGTKLTDDDNPLILINGIKYGDGYYAVTKEQIALELGVENVTRDYIVNYDTGEVISREPIYMGNKELYTIQDLIENELKGELLTKVGEYNEEKGVNKPILAEGMIPVKYVAGRWVVTNEDDVEWYDYSADINMWANVMLLDDIELQGMSNDEIRNSSIADLQGEIVSKEGSMFVWIPRYTYKEVGGSYEIVYSKLTTDYVADGYVKNPAFYFGEYNGATDVEPNSGYKGGGKELMGIWVSKYSAGYAE